MVLLLRASLVELVVAPHPLTDPHHFGTGVTGDAHDGR